MSFPAIASPLPTPGHALDCRARTVLMLAACVWSGHFAALSTLGYLLPGRSSDLPTLLVRGLLSLLGIGLCLAMYLLLRRRAGPRIWPLLLRAVWLSFVSAAVLVLLGKLAFLAFTDYYRVFPDHLFSPYATGMVFVSYLWAMIAWSALYVGAVAIGEMWRRDAQLAAVDAATRQARLIALRLQINPHFLFNTLNTLAGFIALGRKDESERIVLGLSRFFHHTLTHAPSQFVPLSDEIDTVRIYLELETARFPDRLSVQYDIPAETRRALVPGLVLLPLAENSIRHALARSESGIRIGIGARREAGSLLLWLHDDGPANAGPAGSPGLGLSSVRQQLTALYGHSATLEAGARGAGWCNRLRVPWQEPTP